ncbi:ABC transporter permease [Halalkalibacter lacteus]|uniref:ABC transporter permease n=1 Tax=Halalkalibacter lacteus TaxID=3090663 RepID=UPI002FCA535F
MKFLPIVMKDLKLIIKDKAAIIVLFLLPIMFISVMSFALMPVYNGGSDNTISIALIDNDMSKESKQFINTINELDGLRVVTEINDGVLSLKDAEDLILKGTYPMAVIITDEFGKKILNNETITINTYIDPAQYNTSSVIVKALEGVSSTFAAQFTIENMVDSQISEINTVLDTRINELTSSYESKIEELTVELNMLVASVPASTTIELEPVDTEDNTVDMGAMRESLLEEAINSVGEPLILVEENIGISQKAETPNSFQQNVPGYTVMFVFFIVMFAGRSFLNERHEGTFKRVLSAPIGKWSLFFGKMIPNFLISLAQCFVMFAIGNLIFGMALGNSIPGLIGISLCLAWASTSIGMLIASLVRSETQIVGVSMMTVLTLAALGGTMVPLFIMPEVMQKIALFTPHAWALIGYQDLLVRGMVFSDVLLNMLVLLMFGLVCLSTAVWRLRFD